MNRIRTLASGTAVALALAVAAQGCSSDSEESPGGAAGSGAGTAGASGSSGTAGTAGAAGAAGSSGAAGGAGGSGGTGTGGSGTGGTDGAAGSGTGGSDGSGTGGSGTGGSGAADGGSTQCGTGIRNNQTPCTAACTGSVCGLHDLGRRDCACPATGMYQCESCAFPGNEPILNPPSGGLTDCTGEDSALRETACTDDGAMCQSITDAGHVCACWNGVWDCDDKPWE